MSLLQAVRTQNLGMHAIETIRWVLRRGADVSKSIYDRETFMPWPSRGVQRQSLGGVFASVGRSLWLMWLMRYLWLAPVYPRAPSL